MVKENDPPLLSSPKNLEKVPSEMTSIGNKLDESRGVGPGFDFLRIALAVGVVAWHSPAISRDMLKLDQSCVWFFGYAILFAFLR